MRDLREWCGIAQEVISTMGLEPAFKLGVFKEELKNRFRCVVTIDNADTVCYVPSSSRLSNFVDLSNRVVMLRPVKNKNAKLRYAVFAVKYNRSFVLLDLTRVNKIIANQLSKRLFSLLGSRDSVTREKVVDGYKCDLYIEESDTIIEVKSVLAFTKDAVIPTVYSERGINQLTKIKHLLNAGHKVCYVIVSLYQGVERISINPEQKEYYKLFMECLDAGMKVLTVSLHMKCGEAFVKKKIEFME